MSSRLSAQVELEDRRGEECSGMERIKRWTDKETKCVDRQLEVQ